MNVNTTSSMMDGEGIVILPPDTTTAGSIVSVQLHMFEEFGKIPRLSREIVVTEKIDGTNAHIYISDDMQTVLAGSRTRFISPGKTTDNYGFAAWVEANKDELKKLGPGRHYGEWWGKGINRGYGVDDKRFSLFHPRWNDESIRPSCCLAVPTLYIGNFSQAEIEKCLLDLMMEGSKAAPGYMTPEGVIIYHTAARSYFKKTILNDEKAKGDKS